jgi:hypothetical protein
MHVTSLWRFGNKLEHQNRSEDLVPGGELVKVKFTSVQASLCKSGRVYASQALEQLIPIGEELTATIYSSGAGEQSYVLFLKCVEVSGKKHAHKLPT